MENMACIIYIMGGSNSKSIASSFNTVVTEAITKNIISCVYTASQDQNIVIKNTIGDVTIRNAVLSQSTVINSSCLQKALSDANVQNAISNDILQNTSAETYAMLDAFTASGSSSTAMINNMTRNMFTTENISNTLNEVKQSQSINIESTVGNVVLENINMTQGAKLIAQSLADNANILQTMTSYENSANQTTSLTSEGPLDFLGDYAWVIVAIVVLVILALTGYFVFRSSSKSGGFDTIFGGCDECGGKNNQ